jgi:4-amino-4-deoxychorismate lyase
MSQFIETIKLVNSEYQHLDMHVQRIQETCNLFYGRQRDMRDLKMSLKTVHNKENIYKVTIFYDFDFCFVEAVPYYLRSIAQMVLVEDNDIQYDLKFANRTRLDELHNLAGSGNECIIVKNNRITDASYANLVFWNGTAWHTPLHPLLMGTKRKYLLESKKIQEEDILLTDLPKYQKVSLINAMLELGDLEIEIDRIIH